MRSIWNHLRLYFVFLVVIILISGCFFGSISDFSEVDIKGKTNELYNPDFELGEYASDNLPAGWVTLDGKVDDIVWDNKFAKDKGKSLRINTGKEIVIVSEAFDLRPSYVYYSRVFAKTNDSFTQNVSISIVTFNKNGKKLDKFTATEQVGNEWTPVNITTGFFKGSALFGRMIITVNSRAGHPVWLDQAGSFMVYEIK